MPYIGGLYTGIRYIIGKVDTPSEVELIDQYLDNLASTRQQDSVVSVYMCPTAFVTSQRDMPSVEAESFNRPTRIDGYEPKNNKLLTYPYMFMTVDTLNDSKNYRYEWSKTDGHSLNFALYAGMSPNPEIIVSPLDYNGASSSMNATESVSCSGFPQCAYTIDAYRAWLAQKAGIEYAQMGFSAVSAIGSAYTGNLAGGVLSLMGLASTTNNMLLESTAGSKTRGSVGTSTEVASRTKAVYYKRMCITSQYAKMIDGYFDRYGYETCLVKVPNIFLPTHSKRPFWYYVKTRDVSIHGSMPVDDMDKIKSIFNKGVTFWKDASIMGDYSLYNAPID